MVEPQPPGKENSCWNLLSSEHPGQIIPKPRSIMQCPNVTGFLSFHLWNLCRGGKKLLLLPPRPNLFLCLAAGVSNKLWRVWDMFSIVFFLWRKLQGEKERGWRGTLHSKQSRGDNCKVCFALSWLPLPSQLLWIFSASRIWQRRSCSDCGCRWTRQLWLVLPLLFLLIFLDPHGTHPWLPTREHLGGSI